MWTQFFPWCQIVCFIMLAPNVYFPILVPNSLFAFGAKLSVNTILVPNCPVPNHLGAKLSGAKLSYHRIHSVPLGEDNIRHFRRCDVFSS